jgi:predicted deacylase
LNKKIHQRSPGSRARNDFSIAGQVIRLGETHNLHLDYSENYIGVKVSVPVHVICAPKPGPRLFLAASIHGDELNGLGIIHDLLFDNQFSLERGMIVALPLVNVYGLESYSRYLPDRRDLNRSFPGKSSGSLTGRLANLVYSEVIRKCDYGIDFHTAAVRRTNYPNVRADLDKPDVAALARAFGCELIVHNKGTMGSLRRTAVNAGIPTIVVEAGEVWKIEPGVVELGVRGAMNVLRHLKMIPGRRVKPAYQCAVKKSKWIRAERGGVLKFHAKSGDIVRKGQVVASSLSVLGQVKEQIVSPWDGIVLGMSTMPVVKPGEPISHLALPEEPIEVIGRKINRRREKALHSRIQTDLATNVFVTKAPRRKKQPASKQGKAVK